MTARVDDFNNHLLAIMLDAECKLAAAVGEKEQILASLQFRNAAQVYALSLSSLADFGIV